MKFTTQTGQILEVNPLIQASIDKAKSVAPGEGLGPAIGAALMEKIAHGEITDIGQLPEEYRVVGKACGLPSDS